METTTENRSTASPQETGAENQPNPSPTASFTAHFTAEEEKAQVRLIQQVMKAVMREKEHFGIIPGYGNKPTLFKAGAEKLAHTFRLAPRYEELLGSHEDPDFISYKIRCDLIHIPTGRFVGSGLGTCNSREKRYESASNQPGKEENPWPFQNTLIRWRASGLWSPPS